MFRLTQERIDSVYDRAREHVGASDYDTREQELFSLLCDAARAYTEWSVGRFTAPGESEIDRARVYMDFTLADVRENLEYDLEGIGTAPVAIV